MISADLYNNLYAGEKGIALFICNEECFWIADYRDHFDLNVELEYDAYLKRGIITREQYKNGRKEYRYGILKLNKENFDLYLRRLPPEGLLTVDSLEEWFFDGGNFDGSDFLDEVEKKITYGREISPRHLEMVFVMTKKLPSFFINFDKKIYMHMEYDRAHEDYIYPDWEGDYGDFYYMIPDGKKYWLDRSGRDFWKVRFV